MCEGLNQDSEECGVCLACERGEAPAVRSEVCVWSVSVARRQQGGIVPPTHVFLHFIASGDGCWPGPAGYHQPRHCDLVKNQQVDSFIRKIDVCGPDLETGGVSAAGLTLFVHFDAPRMKWRNLLKVLGRFSGNWLEVSDTLEGSE
ncbi:hypothetical protein J6590_038512 [Homalodisca vitripennis]|nr:hypothetical protein J6590_038512 [Homalodisca vitripennis]